MNDRVYYHASDHDISQPDVNEHRRNMRSFLNSNSTLGLFANTDPKGSHIYGEKLYGFRLRPDAAVHEIDDQLRQPGRCAEYYRGIKDVLLDMGYAAVKTTHDDHIALVVLDFDAITGWVFIGPAP